MGMDTFFQFTYDKGCNYLSMLGLKLERVSKRTDNGIPCSHFLLCLSTHNLIVLWLKSDCFYLVSQQELSQRAHFTKHMLQKFGVLQ